MALDPLLPHYVNLTLRKAVRDVCQANSLILKEPGTHQEAEGLDEWVVYWPMWDTEKNVRRGAFLNEFMFQLSCHALLAEHHSQRDTAAPFRVAGLVQMALRNGRYDIKNYGVKPEVVLGGLRIHGGQQQYVPYRNLTFRGEGNFALEQGTNTHTVAVTFTALVGVGG